MSTMRFADEVVPRKDIDEIPNRRTKPDAKSLKLATQIVDSLAADWKPDQYEDTYATELKKRIKAKDEGKEVTVEAAPAERAKVVDLMAALEASVDRSEEHTSELQSLMRISYAVFCLKKKKQPKEITNTVSYKITKYKPNQTI